jgi:hypothetical protein
MVYRCSNKKDKKYKYYGGRGIKVCPRWLSFEMFYKDMGERPKGTTLDRLNGNGNYEPKNCRWATDKEQREIRVTWGKVSVVNELVIIRQAGSFLVMSKKQFAKFRKKA